MSQNYEKNYNRTYTPDMQVAQDLIQTKQKLDKIYGIHVSLKRGTPIENTDMSSGHAKALLDNYLLHTINKLEPYLIEEGVTIKQDNKKRNIYDEYKLNENHEGLISLQEYETKTVEIDETVSNGTFYTPSQKTSEAPAEIPPKVSKEAYKLIKIAFHKLGFIKVAQSSKSLGVKNNG